MQATPPIPIESSDLRRTRAPSRRALRRAAWLGLDALALAGFALYALQSLT